MALVLVGLISFQMYWINNAINFSEDRFRRGVHDALNAVSDKLEQQEIVYTAANKLQYSQQGKTWIGLDSIKFISNKPINESDKGFLMTEEDVKKFYFKADSLGAKHDSGTLDIQHDQPFKNNEGVWIDEHVLVEVKRFKANIDSVVEYSDSAKRKIQKVEEKSEMVTVVLNELFSKERKLQNRIDPRQLQTLLHASLQTRASISTLTMA